MDLNVENLLITKKISIETAKRMFGSDDPQFKRIHHHFHHIVLYIKDFVMKDRCKTYLEIGTHYGHSLSNMLQSDYPSRYMSIDLFQKWGDSQVADMEEVAHRNANLFNINGYEFSVVKGHSQNKEVIKKVQDYFPDGIDLLFIDGDHSQKGITADFNTYFPLVSEGGYVIFDDYLPLKVNNVPRQAPRAVDNLVNLYKDQITAIGLVEDLVNIYELKNSKVGGKNIDFIIRKNHRRS